MSYKNLPDDTRIWIYQCNRKLTDSETTEIRRRGEEFISSWTAHGTLLAAGLEIFFSQFLVVFADEEQAKASGCSIDKSVHFIKQLEDEYAVTLLDRKFVAYKEDDVIHSCTQEELFDKVQQGHLTQDTIVFNNLIRTKGELENYWQVPLRDSWHYELLEK